MLEFDDAPDTGQPNIKVVGVGGGGGNSVNTMIDAGIQGVDFIAVNTDSQVLGANQAPTKMQIGKGLTKGLGAGANPEMGAAAALEDGERLAEALSGADMVFVTAGMGGGTGTGAAPVVAEIARDQGALTVGVVTKPFGFEGMQRKKRSASGIGLLAKAVDALIVIPNDRLLGVAGQKTSLKDAFTLVDAVCLNAVRGISDLVMVPGLINVDFADVRTIMTGTGRALMGTGRASGDNRAIEAAKLAINSPLLEDVSINGATGILVNITGSSDLTLAEVNDACSLVQEAADPECNMIFGSVIDANAGDELRITVIATGFQPAANTAVSVPNGGSGPRRRGDQQMALPMNASNPAGVHAQPQSASAQAGYPAPPVPQLPTAPVPGTQPQELSEPLFGGPSAGYSAVPADPHEALHTSSFEHSAPVPLHQESVAPVGAMAVPPPPAHASIHNQGPLSAPAGQPAQAVAGEPVGPHGVGPQGHPLEGPSGDGQQEARPDGLGYEAFFAGEPLDTGAPAPTDAASSGASAGASGEWAQLPESQPVIRPQAPARASAQPGAAGQELFGEALHEPLYAPRAEAGRAAARPGSGGRASKGHTPWPGSYAAPAHQAVDEELGIEDSEYDKPTFMRRRASQEHASAPHAAPSRYRD